MAMVVLVILAILWLMLIIGLLVATTFFRLIAFLLGLIVITALLFFVLNAEVAASAQLMIYAGGVVVLMVFGLLLTQPGNTKIKAKYPLQKGGIYQTILYFLVISTGLGWFTWHYGKFGQASPVTQYYGGTMAGAGQTLIVQYGLPLEVSAVLLLVSLIVAALATTKNRAD